MNFWNEITDLFLNKIGGSYVIVSILFLMVILILLFLIRSTKEIFLGILFIFLYFMIQQGLLPSWLFFLILALAGVLVTKAIIQLFFSNR